MAIKLYLLIIENVNSKWHVRNPKKKYDTLIGEKNVTKINLIAYAR